MRPESLERRDGVVKTRAEWGKLDFEKKNPVKPQPKVPTEKPVEPKKDVGVKTEPKVEDKKPEKKEEKKPEKKEEKEPKKTEKKKK